MKQNQGFQTKDFILIGILTAVFFVMYMGLAMASAIAGPVIHLFCSGVAGLIGGTIFLLMGTKVPKRGVFTISTIVLMALMQLAGGTYLPWVVTSVLSAVIADIICSVSSYKSPNAIGTGLGIMMIGQTFGTIIPVLFFVDQFRDVFLSRGVEPIFLDKMIGFITGPMALVLIVFSFFGGYVGVMIGKQLMRKHFVKAGVA